MTAVIVLDAGPLGLVVSTNPENPEAIECATWLQSLLKNGIRVCVPEISDYEVRRSLLKIDSVKSIKKLNQLNSVLDYQPITTSAMQQAAQFWAQARNQGTPTADDKALDGDMVLVGQAHEIAHEGNDVVVATNNVRHIGLFADARRWDSISSTDIA